MIIFHGNLFSRHEQDFNTISITQHIIFVEHLPVNQELTRIVLDKIALFKVLSNDSKEISPKIFEI